MLSALSTSAAEQFLVLYFWMEEQLIEFPHFSFMQAEMTIQRSLHPMLVRAFEGAKIYGGGFTFDDTDSKGVATSIAEMYRLIHGDARNAERVFPYIGGEEVNDSPTQALPPLRYQLRRFPLGADATGQMWFEL